MSLSFLEAYPRTFKPWIGRIFKDPGSWLLPSFIVIILCLPVITWGSAIGFGYLIAIDKVQYKQFSYKESFIYYLKSKIALRALLMGLLDLLILLFTIMSALIIMNEKSSITLKLVSAFFLWLDLIYMISSIYRYPILCVNSDNTLLYALQEGFLLTIGKLWHSLFLFIFKSSLLIVSLFTGIGIFVFFFGASTLFDVYHYFVITEEPFAN